MKKKAAALRYLSRERAPRVVSRGEGRVAEKILRVAQGEGIPIVTDEKLAENLLTVEVSHYIPEGLYEVVAELIAFVRTTTT